MNKADMKKLNIVPEGIASWLSYKDYAKLGQLFDSVDSPSRGIIDDNYADLHKFLVSNAGLQLPMTPAAIHLNAFVLLRRGYKVEEITETEYKGLTCLIDGLEQPDKNDMDLYATGGHRDLYNYLTWQMGLSVEAGRGPVWYRAHALIEAYQLSLHPASS